MGSINITGVKNVTPEYKKKLEIYNLCKELNINPPEEIIEYFKNININNDNDIKEIFVKLPRESIHHIVNITSEDNTLDTMRYAEYYEIILSEIPPNVDKIRIEND